MARNSSTMSRTRTKKTKRGTRAKLTTMALLALLSLNNGSLARGPKKMLSFWPTESLCSSKRKRRRGRKSKIRKRKQVTSCKCASAMWTTGTKR